MGSMGVEGHGARGAHGRGGRSGRSDLVGSESWPRGHWGRASWRRGRPGVIHGARRGVEGGGAIRDRGHGGKGGAGRERHALSPFKSAG